MLTRRRSLAILAMALGVAACGGAPADEADTSADAVRAKRFTLSSAPFGLADDADAYWMARLSEIA
jgi:ABC-type glycerol-3-phosphate transport system substrate-binding protein